MAADSTSMWPMVDTMLGRESCVRGFTQDTLPRIPVLFQSQCLVDKSSLTSQLHPALGGAIPALQFDGVCKSQIFLTEQPLLCNAVHNLHFPMPFKNIFYTALWNLLCENPQEDLSGSLL